MISRRSPYITESATFCEVNRLIQLYATDTHKDVIAKRIFSLFNISYEEFSGSSLAQSLGPYYSPIIRDNSGTLHYGDSFFASNIRLYSLGETCPNCAILEGKLREAGIPFTKITDRDVFTEKGYTHFPMLEVCTADENPCREFGFKDAFKLIKKFADEGEGDAI